MYSLYLCLAYIVFGNGELLDNSRNIVCVCVCVLHFLCVVVYVVCVFVCVREIVPYVESGCGFVPNHILKVSSLILWDHFFPKYI